MGTKIDARKAMEMRLNGSSLQEIADTFGSSREAVSKYLHRMVSERAGSFSKCVYPNLKELLRKNGISQNQLAEMLEVSPKTVSAMLTGRHSVSLQRGLAIKQAIKTDMPLEKLFERIPAEENRDTP